MLRLTNKFITLRGLIVFGYNLQILSLESSLISQQSGTGGYTQHTILVLLTATTDRVSVQVLHPAGEVGRLPDHHTHVPVDLQEAGLVVHNLADNDI